MASTLDHAKQRAQFIFKGSVKELAATSVPDLPADRSTAVVTVDEVHYGPAVLSGLVGKDITVRLATGDKLRAGEQAIFYAAGGSMYGTSVVMQSLGHERPSAAASAAAGAAASDRMTRQLAERVRSAYAIVSGQVMRVRAPAADRGTRAGAPKGVARAPARIGEHDPLWQEAVVHVNQVHKGDPDIEQAVVRFASSTDVRWHRAPKFRRGQKGTWLLREEDGSPAKRGHRSTGKPYADHYTCLDPMDFHVGARAQTVRALARAAAPKKKDESGAKVPARKAAKRPRTRSTDSVKRRRRS